MTGCCSLYVFVWQSSAAPLTGRLAGLFPLSVLSRSCLSTSGLGFHHASLSHHPLFLEAPEVKGWRVCVAESSDPGISGAADHHTPFLRASLS